MGVGTKNWNVAEVAAVDAERLLATSCAMNLEPKASPDQGPVPFAFAFAIAFAFARSLPLVKHFN